jgi:hypothetical protein
VHLLDLAAQVVAGEQVQVAEGLFNLGQEVVLNGEN